MSQTCISSTDHVKRDFGRNNDRHNTEIAKMEYIRICDGSAVQFWSTIDVNLSFEIKNPIFNLDEGIEDGKIVCA